MFGLMVNLLLKIPSMHHLASSACFENIKQPVYSGLKYKILLWWKKVCRENTKQSFADSGKNWIGRNFSSPRHISNILVQALRKSCWSYTEVSMGNQMTVPGNISHANTCKTRWGSELVTIVTIKLTSLLWTSKSRQPAWGAHPAWEAQPCLGSTTPNMTAVLHTGPDGGFKDVQSGLRCKVSD